MNVWKVNEDTTTMYRVFPDKIEAGPAVVYESLRNA